MRRLPGTYPVVQSVVRQGPWDLMPAGRHGLGVCIAPPNQLSYASRGYTEMFNSWTNDSAANGWLLWVKPQIDAARALGANVVKLHGTFWGRAGSGSAYAGQAIADSAYFAAWDQFLAYVRSQGMFAYPAIGGVDSNQNDYGGYGYVPAQSWIAAEQVKIARYLEKYADIIVGVDLGVESTIWANASGQGIATYQAVKTAVPRLRFTYSKNVSSIPTPGSIPLFPPVGSFDFIDLHVYYNAAAGDFDPVLSYYGTPVWLGEFGISANAGTPARQSRYNTVKAVMNNVTSGRRLAGAMNWTMWDQDPSAALNYGMADGSGNLRADVPAIFQSFPT